MIEITMQNFSAFNDVPCGKYYKGFESRKKCALWSSSRGGLARPVEIKEDGQTVAEGVESCLFWFAQNESRVMAETSIFAN